MAEAEDIDSGLRIGTKEDAGFVKILFIASVYKCFPGFLNLEVRNASPVNEASALALESLVTGLAAELTGD